MSEILTLFTDRHRIEKVLKFMKPDGPLLTILKPRPTTKDTKNTKAIALQPATHSSWIPSTFRVFCVFRGHSPEQPGNMVGGRYKLLEAIGEGGMGTVWVTEQTAPVRRKVALKLVDPTDRLWRGWLLDRRWTRFDRRSLL